MSEPINNTIVETVEPVSDVNSKADSKADSKVDSNVDSKDESKDESKVDSNADSNVDSKVDPNVDSNADILEPLSKVDSAVQGLSSSPHEDKASKAASRRKSSMVAGVGSIKELSKLASF